jgi:choline monooxygenase
MSRPLARRLATLVAAPWPDAAAPLAAASAPPPSWCVDPAVFAAEARLLFPRWWHPVAPAADMTPSPAAVGARVAGEPLLVTSGEGGRLACFENSCPHQGHVLAPLDGVGRPLASPLLTCGYHGWQFRADDGRLAAAKGVGGVEGFAAREHGLRPGGAAAAWGPVVFASLDATEGGAPPPVSPPASAALAAAGVPTTAAAAARYAVVAARRTFSVRANWKVVVANYLDGGYHVPVAHPALAAGLDMGGYARTLLGGGSSLQTVPPAAGAPARLTGGSPRAGSPPAPTPAAYAYLFPFLCVNVYGGGAWLDLNFVQPRAVDATDVHYVWLRDAAAPPPADIDADVAASVRVQEEDTALCEAVQAGLGARGARGGRYAPRYEGPLHAFHRAVADAYREAGMVEG